MPRYFPLGLCAATLLLFTVGLDARQSPRNSEDADAGEGVYGCLTCHEGIEPIRDPESGMMRGIFAMGRGLGDVAGCVVCHGGDPTATEKDRAHGGERFYPDPGSPWVNDVTCGPCHAEHTGTQWTSLMMSESGKIQGTAWAFGGW